MPVHESEDSGSDDEIQYSETQAKSQSAVPPPSFPSSKSRHSCTAKPTPNSETCKSNSDELVEIDKLLSQQVPPPLILLRPNLTASQLPPSTAPIMTRTARGVARKKTFEPQRMESQELQDAHRRTENKRLREAKKRASNVKKTSQNESAAERGYFAAGIIKPLCFIKFFTAWRRLELIGGCYGLTSVGFFWVALIYVDSCWFLLGCSDRGWLLWTSCCLWVGHCGLMAVDQLLYVKR